ncbi:MULTISPECIES: hypothetical protein [unclassified Mesorhizobium]|uniref:hypothetical protein n=1 Tax=unclassified Mesorhizobium TaxID=325217 RepID=UPI001126A031|nr:MULTISPECIES: hypothetical protein [unclassified Mesorhizobium]TPI19795.1 hypothetical protein FJW10_13695 [Mesorhizobium sp. B4-1-1]TPL49844.1 hypothetical protein FJ957_12355 [Mesorhizobium sp. B2-4-6]
MRKQKTLGLALLASSSLFLADVASAKDAYKTPCRTDAQRVCKMVDNAKGLSCLKQHISELTPACKAFLSKK